MDLARQDRLATGLVWTAILSFTSLTFAVALSYHHELKSQAADTGSFFQLLYQLMATGKPLTTLNMPQVEQHWLGMHFSPLIFLLAPLTQIFDGFYFLSVINTAGFALAAWPIFLACRHLGYLPLQALTWAAFYLINPFVINAAVIDFHEICLAAPLLSYAILYLLRNDARRMVACLILLIAVKEHYGVTWLGFALAWHAYYRDRKFAFYLGLSGLCLFYMTVFEWMPYFAGGRTNVFLFNTDAVQHSRFGWWAHIIESPRILLIIAYKALWYGLWLVLPFLFLPLGAITLLCTGIADMAVNSLSNMDYMRSFSTYHSAAIIPTLTIAAAAGMIRLRKNITVLSPQALLICISLVAFSYSIRHANLPLPGFKNAYQLSGFATPMAEETKEAIHDIHRLLKNDRVIMVATHVAPWFASYPHIYWFPERFDIADTIILYTGTIYQDPAQMPILLFSVPPNRYFSGVRIFMADPAWQPVYFKHHWLVMQKGTANPSVQKEKAADALKKQQAAYQYLIDIWEQLATEPPLY